MFPEGRILEFIIVGAVALIVVGPKDLPMLMRKVGQFLARMRAMAAEFRASFDEMARQSELDELRREVEALRAQRPVEAALGAKDVAVGEVFGDIERSLAESGTQMHPGLGFQYAPTFDEGLPSTPPEPAAAEAPAAEPPKPARAPPTRKGPPKSETAP
jgi:sec-independent protein translocase protein TatB